jgi:hypothetical protein
MSTLGVSVLVDAQLISEFPEGLTNYSVYITRLASNEIFSPSNKIHQEVGQAKDLSAPL